MLSDKMGIGFGGMSFKNSSRPVNRPVPSVHSENSH